jgi:hypothetical protein
MIPETPRIYIHDVEENRSKEVTFEEATKLSLDASTMSKDGFEVRHGRGGGDFLFFDSYSDYNSMYLVGNHAALKLNLVVNQNMGYYYGNGDYRFLGWIN